MAKKIKKRGADYAVQVTPFWFINSHVMQKEADKKTWRKD